MSLLVGQRETLNYLTIAGLERQTGCTREEFPLFVVKELMDNALDACEHLRSPDVDLRVVSEEESLKISVCDNGEGLSDADIDRIRQCFRIVPSARYFRRLVSRGAVGNAWACMLGIAYVTTNPSVPFHASIRSAKGSADLAVRYDEARDSVDVMATQREKTTVTEVTLYVEKPDDAGTLSYELQGLAKQYRLLNPHVKIHAAFHLDKNQWELSYPVVCPRRKQTVSPRSNIWLYSTKEFRELVFAIVRLAVAGRLPVTVAQLMREEFQDVEAKRIRQDILSRTLTLESSPRSLQRLYNAMRSASLIPRADSLPRSLEKHAFKKVVSQTYGAPKQVQFVESWQCTRVNGVYMPVLLQVGLANVPALGRREICIGANHAPKIHDPFPFSFQVDDEQDRFELDKILSKNQLARESPAVMLVNIVCPNLRYLDPAKRELDLCGLGRTLRPLVEQVCRIYPSWRRRVLGFFRVGPIRLLLREELQKRSRQLSQSKDGKIEEDEILPQQALWYKLRLQLANSSPQILEDAEKMHKMRDDFPTQVVAEAKKLGRTREELGIYAAARAEQYFRNQVNSVSWRAVDDLAKLGSDVIFIEKEGIAEALAPFAARRGIALINSRGYASHYARRLMQIARAAGANGFVLTDLDVDGLVISVNQKEVPRIGLDDRLLRKLNLTRSQLAEPYKLRKGDLTKVQKLRISRELKIFLRTRRVELDSVLGAVGAARMWKALEERILEMSPVRNLARSVDPQVKVAEIQTCLNAINELLKELGEPARAAILSSPRLLRFKGLYNGARTIDDLELEVEAAVGKELRNNKVVRELVSKLSEAADIAKRPAPVKRAVARPITLDEMYTRKDVESATLKVMQEVGGDILAQMVVKDIMEELKRVRETL
jgi:DNA topoisomerase VI subunit B